MAQTCSLEGVHFCMAPLAWSVAHKGKPCISRHSRSRSSLLRGRLWLYWDGSTFVSIMQHFWLSMGLSSILDWLLDDGCLQPHRSLLAVHLLSWWSLSSAFFPSNRKFGSKTYWNSGYQNKRDVLLWYGFVSRFWLLRQLLER
jgi:hypothetical protein